MDKLQHLICNRKAGGIVRVAGLAVILVLVYRVDPGVSALYPPCPVHYLTGLFCPGCGSLRALHALLHGRMMEAFSMNALMVISLPLLGLLLVRPAWSHKRWVPWVALAVLIVYAIARNLPVRPFSMLAPG